MYEPALLSEATPRSSVRDPLDDSESEVSATGVVPLSEADFLADSAFSFDSLSSFPHPLRHPLRALSWITSLLFGLASLVLMLAVIAAIPIVNFLALGYMLEAQGRVARTGKLRYAMPLLPLAPRLGGIAFGLWFWLLTVRLIADAATDAATIAPGTSIAAGWRIALTVVSWIVGVHLLLAVARGGGFWCFFRPFKNLRWLLAQWREGGYWRRADAAVREFVSALRVWHHFRLGIVGFVGTLSWLFVPTVLFAALQSVQKPGQVLLTLFGGAVLIPVLAWTPFLQAHFAAESRWTAFRELRTIRELFTRSPMVWTFALIVLYVLSLPLYLFKIAAPPRDAMWFVTLIFVSTIYPAKIFIAWAYARSRQRSKRQWGPIRWSCRLVSAPLLAFYLFLLFFTPAIGAAGRRVLFEYHALLLPTPF